MSFLKLDLHVHTVASGDSLISPRSLISHAKSKGLDGIAITDHNNMEAYREIKELTKNEELIIIPGIEIETNIGEVIGLFLENEIDFPDNNFFTIIDKIRKNEGVVIVPHPFDILRDNHLKMDLLSDKIIKKYIDGMEIINSRIILKKCVRKARECANKYNLFETGGSDAHTPKEIGQAYTLVWNFHDTSLQSIKRALKNGYSKSMGSLSSPFVHLTTVLHKLKKGVYFSSFL